MTAPHNPGDPGQQGSGRFSRLMARTTQSMASMSSDDGIDAVTGLPDRRHLSQWTSEAWERSKSTSTRGAVFFVGIGLIDDINDSYGPDTGDHVLRQLGQRLASIDVPNTRVMRYTGTEFALVFERLQNPAFAEEIAGFLVELITPPVDVGTDTITVQAFVGGAITADNYESQDHFVRDAHEALVKARDAGHGSWHVHDETKRAMHATRIDEERLHQALADNEFLLLYQPIVRTDTRQMIGVEALIRLKSPSVSNLGVLYPSEFMPLLEKSGMSAQVGNWVIHEACRQGAEWMRDFPGERPLFITCNLGARQIGHSDFTQGVKDALSSTGVSPWQLCLDITEATLRYNRHATWAALRELKDLGVKLGLDDFGTGVASLSYLREIKLDLVRVDRAFVKDMLDNREDQLIIKHIVGLAHDLELIVIAEGVEKQEQADVLKDLGVDLGQGYLFGRPEKPSSIANRLRGGEPETNPEWDASAVLPGASGGPMG